MRLNALFYLLFMHRWLNIFHLKNVEEEPQRRYEDQHAHERTEEELTQCRGRAGRVGHGQVRRPFYKTTPQTTLSCLDVTTVMELCFW